MVKIIVFDIDGVLTDGMVQIDENGNEYKRFLLNDIDALNQLIRDGFIVCAITGEDTPLADYFGRRVPWKHFVKGCKKKLAAFQELLAQENCPLEDSAYIGDGLYDVPVLEYAVHSFCPANAVLAAKAAAKIHLQNSGGQGCIVELYELIKSGKF